LIKRITDEIFQVGGGGLTSPEDAAIYLVHFNHHAALVDAGCGGSETRLFNNIRECGVDPEEIEYLLITHCHFDHTGGAKTVKDKTRCLTVAHAFDAPFLEQGDDMVTAAKWYGSRIQPFNVDRKLTRPREEIELGERTITAIHTPGHSPGSVVYLTESEAHKVLFAQDVHGPLDPSILSDRYDYLKSLKLLLSLEVDILCEGHYGIYEGRKPIMNFIRTFMPDE
jgi:glyoxylase-like metal-dependent hydrolase (beta-lactamase superfamily II)